MRKDDPDAFDALGEIHDAEGGGDIRVRAMEMIRAYLELCYELEPRGRGQDQV